jgi:hypothetical protein
MIDNPSYKGKWKAPMIDNPNYQVTLHTSQRVPYTKASVTLGKCFTPVQSVA